MNKSEASYYYTSVTSSQGLDMVFRVILILSLGVITLTKGQTDGTTEGTAGTTGTTDTTTEGTGTSGSGTSGTTDGTPTTGTFPSTTGESTTATAAVATTSATETFENTVVLNNQKVKVGKTTFKCNFYLVFSGDMVNLENSTMSCKGKGKGKPTKVSLITPEGFSFSGMVKPPKTIMSLGGGDVFGEVYKNISTAAKSQGYKSHCGGYNGELEGRKFRGYTTTDVKIWPNAEVDWAFVSTGDAYKSYGFMTDAKIGYSEAEIKMVMKSMKRIEADTCIRFKRRTPAKGKPFLLVMREATVSNGQATCQKDYINSNLKNKEIGAVGKIFDIDWSGGCFQGAFVDGLGMGTPVRMVVSSVELEDNEGIVGLLAHEILHALGVGHTQKRPDRDTYITVNWNNINDMGKDQYKKCVGNTCQTYNTAYDCSSIMHYQDDAFANGNGRTMTAKDANKCKFAYNTKLTTSDSTLLKKMYCDSSNKNLVTSPNYPKNYPASQNKEYPIKAATDHVIEIVFSDFVLEAKTDCSADWVQVVDGDGTELLKKSCGTTKPVKITSKTNSVKIKFRSDSTYHYKGFRAEWKAVKKVAAVDGVWSAWGAYGTCSNSKDGKTQCSKQRYRYCNNPAKSGGGKDCEGSSTEKTACKAADMTVTTSHLNCVITAGWSAYGKGSKCNAACKTTKSRTCTNPSPINSKICDGSKTQTSICTGGDCKSNKETGSIKSPNHPSAYPNSKDQTYSLKVAAGSRIELTFVDFVIEADDQCGYDYVQVLDSDGSQMIKKCGSTKPTNVVSTSNTMTVKFHSDDYISAKGFSATWKKIATSDSGTIKSPNYPKAYSASADKTYSLSVADGSKIELTFTDFQVEAETNCGYDYVEVFDTNGKSLKKLCGSTKPAKITSTGKTMKVKFHSDDYANMKGFSATWKKV